MSEPKTLLVIGKVWPEPDSSAAGKRMIQVLKVFKSAGWNIVFSSAAATGNFTFDLKKLGIEMVPVKLNDSGFDRFLKELDPSMVLFDRFMTEEQFGWRVAEQCPGAIRILDTEDLHCLRQTREAAHKENREWQKEDLLRSEISKRELASIYRSDLTLMISEFEMDILQKVFQVPGCILLYLPFILEKIDDEDIVNAPKFEERKHFITIGNFKHEPNWDTIQFLKSKIWPMIRKQLPGSELHIYGSYVTEKAHQLHNAQDGFIIKGRAEDSAKVVSHARVCLAPLSFGAGLKGKLVEAMQCGTPSVTTKIGSEGINGDLEWSGAIEDTTESIANEAVKLYSDKIRWENAQKNGIEIINNRFAAESNISSFLNKIDEMKDNLENHRLHNFTGSMLMQHTAASSRYMSKWIEEKNRK